MTAVIRKTVNQINFEALGVNKVNKQIDQVEKRLKSLSLPSLNLGYGKGGSGSQGSRPSVSPNPEHTEALRMNREFDKKQRELEALELRKDRFLKSAKFERMSAGEDKESVAKTIEAAKSQRELSYALNEAGVKIRQNVKDTRDLEREQKKANFMTRRFNSSLMQMAGAFGSVYTAYEVFASTISTGMEFEKAEKSMLAVSENATIAGENLKFVREESMRLGVDMMDGTKTLSRYLATVNEDFSTDDARKLFTAMSEISVTMGLTADESKRANIAISQMLSKGQVMSSELKEQLAEAGIPQAMDLMAKAAQDAGLSVSGTKAELLKLMELGKVMTKDVMPHFTKRVSEAAWKNNALSIALEKNLSPALQRVTNQTKLLQEAVYEAGAKDGMMYLAKQTQHLMDLGMSLSGVFGTTLRRAIWLVTTPIAVLSELIDKLIGKFGQLKAFVGISDNVRGTENVSPIDAFKQSDDSFLGKVAAFGRAHMQNLAATALVFGDPLAAVTGESKNLGYLQFLKGSSGSTPTQTPQVAVKVNIQPDTNNMVTFTQESIETYQNDMVDMMFNQYGAD